LNHSAVVPVIGMRVDEIGTLIRDGGAFYLRWDLGGRYELELQRPSVDLVEKRCVPNRSNFRRLVTIRFGRTA
jgi:hypothetical protein